MLLGFKEDADEENVTLDPDSIGFLTYCVIDGINYRVPPLPDFDALDVPYHGMLILDAARLPLSDAHCGRKRLMMLCLGRYNSCAKRDEIRVSSSAKRLWLVDSVIGLGSVRDGNRLRICRRIGVLAACRSAAGSRASGWPSL
jgi:hypothetical protein